MQATRKVTVMCKPQSQWIKQNSWRVSLILTMIHESDCKVLPWVACAIVKVFVVRKKGLEELCDPRQAIVTAMVPANSASHHGFYEVQISKEQLLWILQVKMSCWDETHDPQRWLQQTFVRPWRYLKWHHKSPRRLQSIFYKLQNRLQWEMQNCVCNQDTAAMMEPANSSSLLAFTKREVPEEAITMDCIRCKSNNKKCWLIETTMTMQLFVICQVKLFKQTQQSTCCGFLMTRARLQCMMQQPFNK